MYIPGRERRIIELMLERNSSVTVKELALELDVSIRTIHRDLKHAETTLNHFDMILFKKSGVGLEVKGAAEDKQRLLHALSNAVSFDYTPEERQTIILGTLFAAKEPVKLFALADDLHVTIATISNDLDNLEELLPDYKLELVRKRGFGIQIIGNEKNKRQAISSLIAKYIDPFELVNLYRQNTQTAFERENNIAARLLGFVQAERLETIEHAVDQIKSELPYELADNAYIGLVVHLALAIERLQNGEVINFDQEYLKQIEHTEEFKTACLLIRLLEKELELDIPQDEIGYITMHLLGSKLRTSHDYIIEDSALDIAYKAKELIQYVSNALDVQLNQSTSLLSDLVAHLKPAIYRMKKEMNINNPILEDIERDYKDLFQLIEEAAQKVFPNLTFPKDEIGYLVLHFGAVLFYNQSVKNLKALVVCASGIGTAKILATQLQQQFPEITQIKNISMFELDQTDMRKYDIIFSTIALPDLAVPYTAVSPILTENERHSIKKELRKKLVPYKKSDPIIFANETDYFLNIKSVHQYSAIILELLELFKVIALKDSGTYEDILQRMCADLEKRQCIKEQDKTFANLMQREKQGGLAIPDTSIALFHTRTTEIVRPSLTVYRFKNPFLVKDMQEGLQEIDTVLMMLAPRDAEQKMLEVLSFISSLLIHNKNTVMTLISASENEARHFLTRQLYLFLMDKKLI